MEFRITKDNTTGRDMVEIWRNGTFLAAIYTHEDGMRIVSEHLDGVEHEVGNPPSLIVKFSK